MRRPDRAPRDFRLEVPQGDDRERLSCQRCDHVDYRNPRVVVGSVAMRADRGEILLCRRAIDPGYGLWTIPAGFLEHGETPEQGAEREAWEEARARLQIRGWVGVQSLEELGQVLFVFRAEVREPESVRPGPESLETAWFSPEALPESELAFSSVHWALRAHAQGEAGPLLSPPLGQQPWSGP